MKREQGFLDRLRDEFSDFKLAMEFHLALGGMDVHVHGGGINFEKQAADRITAFHQRIVIAFDERVIDAAIFHGPTVHKNKLAVARRARNAGRTNQTPDANFRFPISDFGFFGQRSLKRNFSFFMSGNFLQATRKNSRAKVFRRRAARGDVRAKLQCGWKLPRRI